jgi:hypothetical protein
MLPDVSANRRARIRQVVETNAQPFSLIGEFYEEITPAEGKRQVHICVRG